MDSVLEVFDTKGRSLAVNDDAGGPDSALKFTPAETTNYFVSIGDTLGNSGRDYTYRIEVTPAISSIAVKILEVSATTPNRASLSRRCRAATGLATLISAKRSNVSGEFQAP